MRREPPSPRAPWASPGRTWLGALASNATTRTSNGSRFSRCFFFQCVIECNGNALE